MALHPDALVVRGGIVRDVATLKAKLDEAIELEEPVQESTLRTFIACFDEPVANPTGGKRKR
jgi:hypothetical protein